MGKRDIVFVLVCLAGGAALASNYWRRDRVEPPRELVPLAQTDAAFQQTVARINQAFHEDWQRAGLEPTPSAPSLILARRLSLALTGAIPSLEEIRTLEQLPESERLEWWTAHLLEDRRYSDYVAERLARAFVGTDDGPFIVYRRRRFVAWLSDRLHRQDMSYDELVRELISQEGLWTDSPAVNFVTATSDPNADNRPDPVKLANRTTRAFLGMRIDCLQCHDDRLDKVFLGDPATPRSGEQRDFHQLAAFFGEVGNSVAGIRDRKSDEGYKTRYLGAEEATPVDASAPFNPEFVRADGTLRERLAGWVTHPENKPFARATVNRFWALLFGRPLIDPVDDIKLHGPFPPALEALAEDFAQHQFDVRRLIRLMVATEAFQRDSRAEFEITTEHEQHWASFPLTRLRPEQVAGSVIQASSLTPIDDDAHILRKLIKFGETNEFVKRYGDTGEDEFADRGGTIPQRLLMMNGELVKERTKENLVFNAATRIAVIARDPRKAVETAYLVVLSRRPTPEEWEHFAARIAPTEGTQRIGALEDLCWVLVNSTEFSWNH
ncbi:MAG: DUF1553 domain-containing protein [Pirellulales bacterium]